MMEYPLMSQGNSCFEMFLPHKNAISSSQPRSTLPNRVNLENKYAFPLIDPRFVNTYAHGEAF